MHNSKPPTTHEDLHGAASTRTLLKTGTFDTPPNQGSKQKRSSKIEVRYRGRAYLCSGEKGGVGKTLAARTLIEAKRAAGFTVQPIEADVANLDIEGLFGLSGHVDLLKEGGYTNLLNILEQSQVEEDIVVSLPAGALAGASLRGIGFLDALPHLSKDLERDVIVVWPIDDKELSVSQLREFIERCPGVRVDVIGNRFFSDSFEIYESSQTKVLVENGGGKFITLPRLQPQVMQELVNKRLRFEDAEKTFPIGNRYEFQAWRRVVDAAYAKAGYLDRRIAE